MKYLRLVLLAGAVFSASGCTEKEVFPALDNVKVFRLSQTAEGENATRCQMMAGGSFLWRAADNDIVCYYTLNTSTVGGLQTADVVDSGEEAEVKVAYSTGDDTAMLIFTGKKLNGRTSITPLDGSSFKVKKGIPTEQSGVLEETMVSANSVSLATEDVVELKQLQSYISFQLLDTAFVRGGFKKIDISEIPASGGTGRNIAGSVVYDTGGNPSLDGDESAVISVIPASGVFKKDTVYYVAMMPGIYPNGIKLQIYDGNSGTAVKIGSVETPYIELKDGEILNLGVLDAHETIFGENLVEILPKKSAIVKKGGMEMTKTIWVYYKPEDMSDIIWTVDDPTKASVAKGASGEDSVGFYQTCIVTPLVDDCTITLTASLPGGTISETCEIEVGDFVDLGLSTGIQWAFSNLKGAAAGTTGSETTGTLQLSESYDSIGRYYQWGWVTPITSAVDHANTTYYLTRFGGTWSAAGIGKYSSTDKKTTLEKTDDAAWVANNLWRIPSKSDEDSVRAYTEMVSMISPSGQSCRKYVSKIRGFTDTYFILPDAGELRDRGVFSVNGRGYYWERDVNTTNRIETGYSTTAYLSGHMFLSGHSASIPVENTLYRCWGMSIRPVRKRDGSGW